MGSYYALKGYSASSQRRIILVKSTQIRWFLRRSGGGGWSCRPVAQRRPTVSKIGLKGLSNYHSNETVVEAARWGASGLNKRATLTEYLLKKREPDNSSKPNWTRAKGSLPEKNTTSKNELLILTPGNVADWRSWSRWWWWWVRTSQANQKSMWQCFRVLRVNPNPDGWGHIRPGKLWTGVAKNSMK